MTSAGSVCAIIAATLYENKNADSFIKVRDVSHQDISLKYRFNIICSDQEFFFKTGREDGERYCTEG